MRAIIIEKEEEEEIKIIIIKLYYKILSLLNLNIISKKIILSI